MLLEPPNQLLLLVVLGGPIRLLYRANRGCGIFQKISTELYGRIPIKLLPAILMRDPACRINAARSTKSIPWRALDPPQSIRIDLWALWVNPDGSLVDEVSFKIKDTLLPMESRPRITWTLLSCICFKRYYLFFLPDRRCVD